MPPYICEHLCHLWEAFLYKRFCEFRAFCGNLFSPTDFRLAQMVRVRGDVNNGLKADGMVRIESDKSDKSVVKKYIVRVRRNLTRIKQMRRGSHGMHGTHGSWLIYL